MTSRVRGAAAQSRSVLLLVAAVTVASCRAPSTAPPAAAVTASAAPSPDADAVDRLRALGYVGFTPRGAQGSGVVRREAGSHPGYNLYTNRDLCSAALVDERGALENYWSASPCGRWSNVELLSSGDLLVIGAEATATREPDDIDGQRYLSKLTWDGRTVWRRSLPAHHDVELTPEGELLTLLAVYRKIPEIDPNREVRDNRIARLTADGQLIESLSLYDVFQASPELVKLQRVKGAQKREVDLFHANSVEWLRPPAHGGPDPLYGPGRVLVSVRHQDAVVVVDWKARRLAWAWGQGEISGPHDATRLENGHVLLFDNGIARGWSRVVELDPARRRIAWEYRAPTPREFFTLSRGSNQRLPNGNTLIAQSDAGRAFEVTAEGRIVWEFWEPVRQREGRARLDRARQALRARPGRRLRPPPRRGPAPGAGGGHCR